MKKHMKKILFAVKLIPLALIFLMCTTSPQLTGEAVSGAVQRCLTAVIPSLFAMMTVSAVMIRSGVLTYVPKAAGRLSSAVFGMEGFVLPVFIFSMFGGYPVGTSMLLEQYEKGLISKERASILSGLCFGAGPAFVFVAVSGRFYSSPTAGMIIIVSTVSANVILTLLLSPLLKRSLTDGKSIHRRTDLTCDMLTGSIISSGRSMAVICFTVTAFSVVSAFLDYSGIFDKAGSLLSHILSLPAKNVTSLLHGAFDITDTGQLPHDDHTLLPFLCAITSFGGICVLFQLSALIRGRLSMKPIILIRTAAGILSAVICRIVTPFFLRHELRAVSLTDIRLYSSRSPVPSVMLMIMTFMLFLSYNGITKKKGG